MSCKCKCECDKGPDAYELLKPLPGLDVGVVFIHDKDDDEQGSPAYGCFKLAWDNGGCQGNYDHAWCGHTFVLPGQMCQDTEWFRKVRNGGRYK